MPTQHLDDQKIKEIKSQYSEVYLTDLDDQEVVFKALSVSEYNKSLDVAYRESSADAEEYVIDLAVIFPSDLDLDKFMIGEISALSDEILEQSGFSDYEKCISKIDTAREKSGEVVSFMIAMIIASEQGYSMEQLRDMTFAQVADKAAMAERIFEIKQQMIQGGEIVLEVRDPSQKPEDNAKAPTLTPEEFEAIKRGEYVNPEKTSTIGTATTEDPIARKLREALG